MTTNPGMPCGAVMGHARCADMACAAQHAPAQGRRRAESPLIGSRAGRSVLIGVPLAIILSSCGFQDDVRQTADLGATVSVLMDADVIYADELDYRERYRSAVHPAAAPDIFDETKRKAVTDGFTAMHLVLYNYFEILGAIAVNHPDFSPSIDLSQAQTAINNRIGLDLKDEERSAIAKNAQSLANIITSGYRNARLAELIMQNHDSVVVHINSLLTAANLYAKQVSNNQEAMTAFYNQIIESNEANDDLLGQRLLARTLKHEDGKQCERQLRLVEGMRAVDSALLQCEEALYSLAQGESRCFGSTSEERRALATRRAALLHAYSAYLPLR
jgi:hypothetical protein